MLNKPRPTQPCNSLHPYRWSRSRALRDVVELNEHLLDLVAESYRLDPDSECDLLAGEAHLLATLDPTARRRAADIPLLLVDLNFNDILWWKGAVHAAERPVGNPDPSPCIHRWQPTLTREALMVTWSAVREDRSAASLLFGISGSVSALIGSLSPRQVDYIGVQFSADLRLRWPGSRVFWRRLLSAALAHNESALTAVHLYALQLIGGELMRVQEGRVHPSRPARHACGHKALSHTSS